MAMNRRLLIVVTLLFIIFASNSRAQPEPAAAGSGGIRGTPLREVAAPLRDLWLRYHETGLCLGVDSVFVFQARGLEIWSRVKDERSYQQLTSMVDSLRDSYRIELYATHADREKKPYAPEDDDPPPSLWTNAELRFYLRDPYYGRFPTGEPPSNPPDDTGTNPELKRHLKLFCDQIFEWVNKMARLAGDLPTLAEAGYGADVIPEIQNRARAVCLDHAQEIGKCASRLVENLGHAIPHGSGNAPGGQTPKPARPAVASPNDGALLVADQAQDLAQRVTHFMYPQAHTVTLTDLREPSLIDSLKALQQIVADFATIAKKAR
jgi:hypothetical protein